MRRELGATLMLTLGGCEPESPRPAPVAGEVREHSQARARMVREQLQARGIRDGRVLAALGRVPRHAFVPLAQRSQAYEDGPLPIGQGQTISQPYIVAFMTEALGLKPTDRVLEIGTGSGYQAAVLSELVAEVYTIELVEALAQRAEADLTRLGYANVRVRCGDGNHGWPEMAPFDAIMVTCAPEAVPQALLAQLRPGGCMILPLGPTWGVQELLRLRKGLDGTVHREELLPVRFVPLVTP